MFEEGGQWLGALGLIVWASGSFIVVRWLRSVEKARRWTEHQMELQEWERKYGDAQVQEGS